MSDDNSEQSRLGKRQLIGGALSTVFSYAALFAVVNEPVKTFITNAHWQQAPLHLVFAMVTATVGAAAVAAYDHYKAGKSDQAPSGPK